MNLTRIDLSVYNINADVRLIETIRHNESDLPWLIAQIHFPIKNCRALERGHTLIYGGRIFGKRQILNSGRLVRFIFPHTLRISLHHHRMLIFVCSTQMRWDRCNCQTLLIITVYKRSPFADFIDPSTFLAYHSQITWFSHLSSHMNFIVQRCDIYIICDQICQMSKANMLYQVLVIIMKEAWDI